MKRCLEATSQPLHEWESGYELRRQYERSLKEATEEMFQQLENVAPVDASDKQRMSDLVKAAAKLWLDAGQQRCRMFLLMSPEGDEPTRSARDGILDIVVLPEVRRMGNSQGERLEKDELVIGCKGEFSMVELS